MLKINHKESYKDFGKQLQESYSRYTIDYNDSLNSRFAPPVS